MQNFLLKQFVSALFILFNAAKNVQCFILIDAYPETDTIVAIIVDATNYCVSSNSVLTIIWTSENYPHARSREAMYLSVYGPP